MAAAINEFRREKIDQFWYYRNGLVWNRDERRRNNYSKADLPLLDSSPFIFVPNVVPLNKELQRPVQHQLDIDQYSKSANIKHLPPKAQIAWRESHRLRSAFSTRKTGFRYWKSLGWGGQGIASAYEQFFAGRKVRNMVVKMNFAADPAVMKNEILASALHPIINSRFRHRRCEHIVQITNTPTKGTDLLDGNNISWMTQLGLTRADVEAANAATPGDNTEGGNEAGSTAPPPPMPTVLIIEMLENGNLNDFLVQVREHNETVPQTVLWHFFKCLVRMCIGMAYPPDTRPDEYKNTPGPITETVPRTPNPPPEPRRFVHFDMDPLNIFIGGFKGAEHRMTPILKLGDFGCAANVADDRVDLYYEQLRWRGKRGFFAPEQFCVDWDYIPRDSNLVAAHEVAGNFRAHTNVWSIGLLMECIMTLCKPRAPPFPATTTRFPPAGLEEYYSYGTHLESLDIDNDLLNVVMRCQAHMPAHRPDLAFLETFVSSAIESKVYPNESDDEISAWVNRVMFTPPPSTTSTTVLAAGQPAPVQQVGIGHANVPTFPPQGTQTRFDTAPMGAGVPAPLQPVQPGGTASGTNAATVWYSFN
ncbi:kinase-like domain-containing protein [Xylariaceae sp. FL1019]|nr:kinase-like domain-containing protein [Xylariaceae sp. FL1019]